MKNKKVTVLCGDGLHLRVASKVASIALKSGAAVKIRSKKDHPFVNACSVLELLTLGATLGTPLEIVAEGPNEDGVLNELSEVFSPCADN